MKTILIACEGPTCNHGMSASEREADLLSGLPRTDANAREDAFKFARSTVSKELAVTEHARCGIHRSGYALFACKACGAERVYGGTLSGFYA